MLDVEVNIIWMIFSDSQDVEKAKRAYQGKLGKEPEIIKRHNDKLWLGAKVGKYELDTKMGAAMARLGHCNYPDSCARQATRP